MEILLYGALLLSQIGTGAKQYAMKKCGALAPGARNSICINLIRAAICFVVSLLIWLVTDRSATTLTGVLIAAAAGVGTALNLYTWILSAQRISLTLLEGVCTVGSLVIPLFLAPILYRGESVTLIQWIGTAMVFLSLLLFSKKQPKKQGRASLGESLTLLLLCGLGVTVSAISKKLYTFYVNAQGLGSVEIYTLISFFVVLCIFALLLPIHHGAEKRRHAEIPSFPFGRVWIYVLIAAVALYVSELFATYASDLPSAVYYSAIKVLNVLGCFVLDVTVFKEKITLKSMAGLSTLLAAVILINV